MRRQSHAVRRQRPALAVLAIAGLLSTAACGRQALGDATASPTTISIGGEPTTTVPATTTLPPTTTVPATTTTPVPSTSAAPVSEPAPTPPAVRPSGVPPRLAAPGPLPVLNAGGIPNAGQWVAIGPAVAGSPAMYGTQYPSKPGSKTAVGIAWIDPGAVRAQFQPGTTDPPGRWLSPPSVLPEWQRDVAAVFNGGFKTKDSRGGIYLEGREAGPLRPGAASAVIDTDGVLTVGQWGRDVGMNDRVATVRQNLELIVDDGKVNPRVLPNDVSQWGATLDAKVEVPRSALGVRADGAIIYAGGPGLSARGIADIMAAAGSVRAMELDINPQWVTFTYFTWDDGKGAPQGAKLTGAMTRPENRFLVPDERDFFSLFTRAL